MTQLSIVLPCYNEEDNLARTVRDVDAWFEATGIDGEILVVDDGSTDGTGEILKTLAGTNGRIRVLTHERNRGYGAAVRSGLDAGVGEWLAFMDCDGQFLVGDFEKLIPLAPEADVIVGRRFERADPWVRRFNAWCFGALNRILFAVRVPDINCAMKLICRRVWPRIRPRVTTGAIFNLEMFARIRRHGIVWQQVTVNHYPRRAGQQTGANPRVILRAVREMLLLRWSLWV